MGGRKILKISRNYLIEKQIVYLSCLYIYLLVVINKHDNQHFQVLTSIFLSTNFVLLIYTEFEMKDIKPIIIRQTDHGKVFKCSKCNLMHVEFKNLNFNFTTAQYDHFASYIENLDGSEWEGLNKDSNYSRKIMIPIGHQNFNIILNVDELDEFNNLLNVQEVYSGYRKYFEASQFDFYVYLN